MGLGVKLEATALIALVNDFPKAFLSAGQHCNTTLWPKKVQRAVSTIHTAIQARLAKAEEEKTDACCTVVKDFVESVIVSNSFSTASSDYMPKVLSALTAMQSESEEWIPYAVDYTTVMHSAAQRIEQGGSASVIAKLEQLIQQWPGEDCITELARRSGFITDPVRTQIQNKLSQLKQDIAGSAAGQAGSAVGEAGSAAGQADTKRAMEWGKKFNRLVKAATTARDGIPDMVKDTQQFRDHMAKTITDIAKLHSDLLETHRKASAAFEKMGKDFAKDCKEQNEKALTLCAELMFHSCAMNLLVIHAALPTGENVQKVTAKEKKLLREVFDTMDKHKNNYTSVTAVEIMVASPILAELRTMLQMPLPASWH